MYDGLQVWPRHMNGGMNYVTGPIQFKVRRALVDYVSVHVDFEQRRRCYLIIVKAKRMYEDTLSMLVQLGLFVACVTAIVDCNNGFG